MSHRSKRRCWPCRTSAQSGSVACLSVRPEKLRPSTQRACAWALATWCWLTSLLRASATASQGPRAVGTPISITQMALRGHSGAAALVQGPATTTTSVREHRPGAKPSQEVGFLLGATLPRALKGLCQKAAWWCVTALRHLGGPPQRGVLSRAWVGAPASHLRYPTVRTCLTHRHQCVCANPAHTG